MKVIIDRFEGKYAVAELPDGSFCNIPSVLLEGAVEGDVVEIRIDRDETARRREAIKKKVKKLFE